MSLSKLISMLFLAGRLFWYPDSYQLPLHGWVRIFRYNLPTYPMFWYPRRNDIRLNEIQSHIYLLFKYNVIAEMSYNTLIGILSFKIGEITTQTYSNFSPFWLQGNWQRYHLKSQVHQGPRVITSENMFDITSFNIWLNFLVSYFHKFILNWSHLL